MTEGRQIVGCLFGSFNPIHVGHLIIAEFMVSQTEIDHVQFVVSPQNPLKEPDGLAPEADRLAMALLAVEGNPRFSVNDIEFGLSKPSYTVRTLEILSKANPETEFRLIAGSDSLAHFIHWKDWEKILDRHVCCVYLRPGFPPGELASHPNVMVFKGPLLDISATYIRDCVRAGQSIRYMVSEGVARYIYEHGIFS